ncbi:MAG TPA: ABC transporter permease [Verrucomicrobiae bacterium]
MQQYHKFISSIRALFGKRKLDAEMDEEMRSHVEMRTQANINAGMNPDEARYAATREFGWRESIKETCREQRRGNWIESLWRDLHFAARMLCKNPGFTLISVLTLALGLGVNTSMFTALQALISRPLTFPEPGGLMQLFQTTSSSRRESHHSVPNFLDYKTQDNDFEFIAAMNDKSFNLSQAGQPAESVRGLQTTADFFPLLGIQPELGRVFVADEDQAGRNNVVVLDHGFWLRRFAGDTNIIGRVIRLDGESVTVVGVMPARFHDIMLMGPVSLWRPITFTDEQRANRGFQFLKCIARVRPEVSRVQAQARLDALAARMALDHPDNSAEGLRLVPLAEASLPPEARTIVWSVMGLAGFVLLIACANLANLQFARTARRGGEFAIRGALGAPRARLLRQLLTESLLLALLGGLLSLLVASWSNAMLGRQFVSDGETVLSLSLNLKMIGFALVATTLSGLAFGLVPAWLASRTEVNAALKQGSRGTTSDQSQNRLQHTLIIAEVALALTLLAGAGLVIRGLQVFAKLDPGWRVDGMTIGYLTLPESKYGSSAAQMAFVDRLQERLAVLPGVERIAVGWTLPLRQFNVTGSFTIDGRPDSTNGHAPSRFVNGITPHYFETLGIRVVAGRDFTTADNAKAPAVVIINETMAHAFWSERSPIGQRIDGEEIVGVVGDVRFPANPGEQRTPFQTYRPFAQSPGGIFTVAIRGVVQPNTLRHVVTELDPDQPVGSPGSARADIGTSLDNWDVGGKLLGSFAFLGLFLAGLGIYGVISGFVIRRTGEIGVRMALGAQLHDVLWLVIGRGLRLSLIGTAIGLVGAFGLARLLGSVLPGLPGGDPLVVTFVGTLMVAITILACWFPAWRAAKVDPMVALRNE